MSKVNSGRTTIQIGPHFKEAEAKIAPLGQPTTEELPWQYAIQQLEHGWMLHLQSLDTESITVLFDLDQKTWMKFLDTWDRSSRPDSCPEVRVPPGNFVKPERGFGKVWCGLAQRTRIGFGLHVEFGPRENKPEDTLYCQDFQRGRLLGGGPLLADYVTGVSGKVIFILKADKTWELTTYIVT